MATAIPRSPRTVLSSTITYQDNKVNRQTANAYWSLLNTPLQKIGMILRNAFYLPWYKAQPDQALLTDHTLGTKVSNELMGNISGTKSNEMRLIKDHFNVQDITVRLEGGVTRIFTVRVFFSEKLVNKKQLQLILFSYNENREQQAGNRFRRRWEPLTLKELSESPLLVLKALQKEDIRVHSFIATSLGNVTLDGLKDIPQKSVEAVPPTLVINRGLTSVKKVANQLYAFPFNYLLYGAAKLTGWDADPEQGLLTFLEKNKNENSQRTVVIIEASNDFYFSKTGGFESNFHNKITQLGASVFRAAFYPFPFHTRSHHAISLEHLVNNQAAKVLADTAGFSLEPGEKVSSLIAKNVFLAGEEELHTCFYVCGNDATLNIATARDALPLLAAFVEEGKKMESSSTAHELEQTG